MAFHARDILFINFGQLGDVVLGLPALRAVRGRFPHAKITVLTGKQGAAIVALSGCADAQITVDRVALRDGNKLISIGRIGKLIKDVRQRGFDFVIDVHSLSETNLLGYLSGAQVRLYARRPGRSLDWLANFRPAPPAPPRDNNDPTRHQVDRYLDVLKPLGVENAPREPHLYPPPEAIAAVEKMLGKHADAPLVGLYPGAGHASRMWPLANFAELAGRLISNGLRVVVITGPEERAMLPEIRAGFPPESLIFDTLTIPQLAAMLQRLSVVMGNDTGPMHIAAAVRAPVVIVFNRATPHVFTPIGEQHRMIYNNDIRNISVGEVYTAMLERLARPRVESGEWGVSNANKIT